MRVISGHWVIGQLSSATQDPSSQIKPCLDVEGVVGYGPRIPVNFLVSTVGQFNLPLLDRLRKISNDKGKLFKPRIIYGKYALLVKGITLPTFTDSQGKGPMPFLSGGGRVAPLEDLMSFVVSNIAQWAANKPDVRAIDCGWASLNYSEQYFGPGVQGAYGASTSQNETYLIASEKRMIDAAITAAAGIVPVGFGLSGHGPIDRVSTQVAAYLADKPKGTVTMQANGWAPEGEWGGALESKLDAGVWPKDVVRGLQDISAPSGRSADDNKKLFARVTSVPGGIHYTESYYYEFGNGAIPRFQDNTAALNEFYNQLKTVKTLSFDPGNHDTELEDLLEQLEILQGQLLEAQNLVAEVTVDIASQQQVLAATNQTVLQLQGEIHDVEAEIAALGG